MSGVCWIVVAAGVLSFLTAVGMRFAQNRLRDGGPSRPTRNRVLAGSQSMHFLPEVIGRRAELDCDALVSTASN